MDCVMFTLRLDANQFGWKSKLGRYAKELWISACVSKLWKIPGLPVLPRVKSIPAEKLKQISVEIIKQYVSSSNLD